MANGFRYHPSSRQRLPFERRSLWPQEEEERIPGSTYSPRLGSDSPINYEALGLPMDRRQREEEQFIRSMWGDPATSDYDIQVINREDLGLPPLGSRQPSIMPPMVTDFKTDVSNTYAPISRGAVNNRSVDDIYNAIIKSEHSPRTRSDPWIKTKAKPSPGKKFTAWGEVQITDGTMELLRDTPGFLTSEEWQFANRYASIPSDEKAKWLTGPYEKEMYRRIAKRLMEKYLYASGGDARGVITKWYLGPNKKGSIDDLLKLMRKKLKGLKNEEYLDSYLRELKL